MLCWLLLFVHQSLFSFLNLKLFVQPFLLIVGWTIEYLIVLIVTSRRRSAVFVTTATLIAQRDVQIRRGKKHFVEQVKNIRIVGKGNSNMLLAKSVTSSGTRRK